MKRNIALLTMLAIMLTSIVPAAKAYPFDFADPAFQALWNRTDAPVKNLQSDHSWLWGPEPLNTGIREPYAQSSNGTRLVQYFDKSRMEINTPNANRNELWYVTNGLLPIEMITGQMQVGDSQFEQRQPASIAAIGDPTNTFPTYADLAKVYTQQGAGDRVGNPVTGLFNPSGAISSYDTYRNDPATFVAMVENGHGIPSAFLDYMNVQSGSLGRLFAFGAPVSGAYWVQAKLIGTERPIMFQVFERRILTYTPINEPAFRTESGNVGRHYLQWRYPAPKVEVSPAQGPAGTTFTVRITGLPAGEEATLINNPPPYGKGFSATVVGSAESISYAIPTSPTTASGTWVVTVTRSTSFVSSGQATYMVTEP